MASTPVPPPEGGGEERRNGEVVHRVPNPDVTPIPVITTNRPTYTQQAFNRTYGLIPPDETNLKGRAKQTASKLCTSLKNSCMPKSLLQTAYGYVPFLETLRTYKIKEYIVGDVVAGLSVGMVHIPQGMGFALLAAVAPVYGLYATFWQVLIYMLFGHCRHLSIGTMAVISLIIGAVVERETSAWKLTQSMALSTDSLPMIESNTSTGVLVGSPPLVAEGLTVEDRFRASVACGVSMIAGFTMLIMGICRFGVLTTFMPSSFIGGFTTAASFHIKATQLKSLLNIPVKRYGGLFNYPRSMVAIFEAVPLTNIPDLVISLICFTFLVVIKEFINVRFRKKLPIPIPADMVVVTFGTLISYLADLQGRYGVKVIGFIPKGIPGPVMPNLDNASSYALEGIVAGVTSFAISISMVDILTKKYRYKYDPNKELIAYGLSYGLSSFFHCFVGAAAPPRCFVMDFTGGKTQVASAVTTVLLLLVLLVIAPVFRYLPNACLACIIIVALFPLFKQFSAVPRIFRVSKPDFCIWVITFLVSTILDVSVSLGVGIVAAIIISVLPSMWTAGYKLTRADSPDLYAPEKKYTKLQNGANTVVFRYECTLYYLTIKNFKKQLFKVTFDPFLSKGKENNSKTDDSKSQKDSNDVTVKNGSIKMEADSNSNDQKDSALESKVEINPSLGQKMITSIILDCAPICYTDLMGVNTLNELRDDYHAAGVDLILADCNPVFVDKLTTAGFYDKFHVFPTVQDAMAYCEDNKLNEMKEKIDFLELDEDHCALSDSKCKVIEMDNVHISRI